MSPQVKTCGYRQAKPTKGGRFRSLQWTWLFGSQTGLASGGKWTIRLLWTRIAVVCFALLLLVPLPAQAHGYIVRAIPEDRATLERAPARVQYWFSENLEPDFSTLIVRDQRGNVIATGGVSENDNTLLTARLPANLPDGAYLAELRIAFASDGHVIVETRAFFVGAAVAGVNSTAGSDQAVALEVVWRALLLASVTTLFGAFTLYAGVLVPAWGNPGYAAGYLPPRVMNRLNWLVGVALAVAFAANILALIQQTMVFFDADLRRVVEQQLMNVVRVGTRFGDVWNWRMALLELTALLFAVSLFLRERQPEAVRACWTANIWVLALVVGTLSIASHASGSLVLPWAAVASDWLHALGVGYWAGGVVVLALVLPPALQPYHGDTRRLALLAALKRFSPIAVASVLVVISTGVYNAANWIRTPDNFASSYSGALALKLILVGALLLVGLAHQIAVRPERYARWGRIAQTIGDFVPTLRLEAALVGAALVSVGLLSATPLPRQTFTQPAPPSESQTVGDLTITKTITPGGPGVNTYDTRILRDGQPVDNAKVRLVIVNPARDVRGAPHDAEPVGDGLYAAAGDEIDQTGEWWSLLDITTDDGATARAAFAWHVSADAAVIQTLPPNAFNVFALLGVLAALGYAARPAALRFYRRLDLSPASVTAALVAIGATVGVVVMAYLVGQNSQARYEAELNPPPTVVNTVLPDAESLARGQTLYTSRCPGWAGHPQTIGALAERIPTLRDDTLFTITRDGWRSLPACDAALTDSERWDVVNFLRTFARSPQ